MSAAEQIAEPEAHAAPPAEGEPATEAPAAPEGENTAAPAQPPPDEKKAAREARETARFAALARAERERRAKEAKIAEREATIAQKEQQLEQIRGRLGQFKDDPDGVMRAVFGVTFEEAVRTHLLQNTPEAKQTQVTAEVQALRDELRAFREAEQKAKAEHAQRVAEQQQTQAVRAVQQEMMTIAQKAPETYPHLAGYDDATLATALWNKAQSLYKATGKPPDEETVVRALEEDAAVVYKNYEQRRLQRIGAKPPSDAASSERDSQGSGPQATRPKARTLTNSATSTKATTRPQSEDEIDAWALAELRQALRRPQR